ncbi:MAG TPA: SUMF1/EgtB/PvdO family nonheme iron enzyme [Saprospiraceae bacterium]|nr:SUMF1/EgtB/PvdO family nonheme iron enzyme [Saprospiraceae bacterium]HMQ82157.1 SUMF1/EgtB/PvdO family nonheme iron enzyme [Saprospiraceae bacterium]
MKQQNDANPSLELLKRMLPDLDLVFVEGGTFQMGDEVGDLGDACRPTHRVKVPAFYFGKYPVTQRLWPAVMGNNPSVYKGERRPVENVSWEDAQAFIKKLNLES